MKFQQSPVFHSFLNRLTPWLAFLLIFASGWRVYDLARQIPAYGDALEVIWGIEWYHEALFERHVSPFFTAAVFHPNGWQTASLAHTPLLFLMGSIVMALGGSSALSYNLLVIGSLLVAFTGARRFFQNYVGAMAALTAALVFTFIGMRWERLGGHLHILFATSVLPWYLDSLYRCCWQSTAMPKPKLTRQIVVSGLWWGLMMNFSLYTIFWGPLGFVIGGWCWFSARQLRLLIGITSLALLLAAPLIVLFYQASMIELPEKQGILYLLAGWGASVNSLFVPNLNHPITWIRAAANFVYQGPLGESGQMNLGFITWLLAVIGLLSVFQRKQRAAWGLLWLALLGFLLSFGVLLRWNGWFLELPSLSSLDQSLWQWGHAFKPDLFDSAEPPFFFDQGIPMPSYLFAILVPFWESARVLARYAFVGGIGLMGLAAIGLQRLQGLFRWLLVLLWLLESLPSLTGNLPLPPPAHPAYVWVAQQTLPKGEGIVDLTANPARMTSGEIIYATRFHPLSTLSGVGSFAPRQLHFIQKWLYADANALSNPETVHLLLGYGARYVLFHVRQPEEVASWEKFKINSAVYPLQCFDPAETISPWPYPICVAELLNPPLWPTVNTLLDSGWSGTEEWGVWAEGTQSNARWLVTRSATQTLQLKAFPYCPAAQEQSPGQYKQTLAIWVNRQLIGNHDWQACEEWQGEVTIPTEAVVVGWNQLEFRYGYAISPVADSRQLSVGFSQIQIIPAQ